MYYKIFNRGGGDQGWKSATRIPDVPEWTGDPGPKAEATTPQLSPLETFQLFVTEELLDYTVNQTNLYMTQNKEEKPVTKKEMKKFIGLTLLTGLFIL